MSFPWMHCRVFTIGSGPACGATGKTKSQAMTSVVPFGLQAAMTANERAGRGLHGSAGGSEGALDDGGRSGGGAGGRGGGGVGVGGGGGGRGERGGGSSGGPEPRRVFAAPGPA